MTKQHNLKIWIPQTRLHAPRIGDDILTRPVVLSRLHQAIINQPFTLISAPAGSGKTTLVALWLRHHAPFPVIWLRLDEEENDPTAFFMALLAAIKQLAPDFGADWQSFLTTHTDINGAVRRLAGLMVNEVLDSSLRPFAIVLDDLHRIEETAVFEALDSLLENLPQEMHIIATSRYDPPLSLARMRLQGRLAEFRLDDIRFDSAETQSLLNQKMGLNLSAANLSFLHAHTEGWVAGLRLLVLSLNRLDSDAKRAAFLQRLPQADRHIFEFLADEVLNGQPPVMKRFLLETAVLDEMTPELCTAVTQRSDAAQLLDEILRRNLFLTLTVDGKGNLVYRYHDLFVGFLRQRLIHDLPQAQIQKLHRRAAEAVATADKSTRHYLAAGLWSEAADTIEQAGLTELMQGFVRGQWGQWIGQLPKDAIEERPAIAYILGGLAHQAGRMDEAKAYLEKAVSGLETTGDETALAGAMFRLAGARLELEGPQASLDMLNNVLARPLPTPLKIAAHIDMAWSLVPLYDWPQVDKHVAEAINLTLASGDVGAFHTLAQHMGITIYFGDLGLAPFQKFCAQALARFGDGEGIIQMGVHLHLGIIAALNGRLDEALQFAARSAQISDRLGGFAYVDQNIGFVQGVVALAHGNRDAIAFALEEALRRADERGQYRAELAALCYYYGRFAWLDGDERRIQEMRVLLDSIDHRLQSLEAEAAHLLLDAYLADLSGQFATSEQSARQAIQLQNRYRHPANNGCTRLALAELYLRWKQPSSALTTLQPALAEWERRGMPGVPLMQGPSLIPLLELAVEKGVQVDFAQQVLDLFPGQAKRRAVPVPGTGEVLTPREVEVLRLIMTGASNRAIAEQLVISERTVKSHVTKILAKMNASSRTEAAAAARAFLR